MSNTNVLQLSQPGTFADPLTEVLRNGARALLTQAVEAEVAALLASHSDKLTEDGRQRLVRRASTTTKGSMHALRNQCGGSVLADQRTAPQRADDESVPRNSDNPLAAKNR